jgi:coenzyme F420-reducing hydrogenase beta subunit
MNNITQVDNKCVGCRSCEQVCPLKCIQIKENEEGFLYPFIVEEKCINCGVCLKHCPSNQELKITINNPKDIYAFRNKDENSLMKSASGGAATVASQIVLCSNGVVYGAAYDRDLVVKHIRVTDLKDLDKLQSSKYVQSDTGDCYSKIKEDLNDNKNVLFIGTPCQVNGLYRFLGNAYEQLYTIDLICHGVPSPKFLKKYFEYKEEELGEKIESYNFRSKDQRGWGTQYMIKTQTQTQTQTQTFALDKYGSQFLAGDCYRESCYLCRYSNTNRIGDITIGDFWGIMQSHPDFFSEKGVSCILVNTDKGQLLFSKMKERAVCLETSLQEALIKQGNLISSTRRKEERDTFYEDINNEKFIEQLTVGIQLKSRIKSIMPIKFLNLLKRVLS